MEWLFLIAFILILVMNIYAFYQIAYEKGVKIANRKKCKWNYISEVGLPPKGQYDWVLVKTDIIKDGIPYIAELRDGKWWSRDIEFELLEEALHCKVIAWADTQLIEDKRGII